MIAVTLAPTFTPAANGVGGGKNVTILAGKQTTDVSAWYGGSKCETLAPGYGG